MESLLTTDACTMPTAERPLRLAEFDALFATSVCSARRRGDDVRMHLADTRGRGPAARDAWVAAGELVEVCCAKVAEDVDLGC